MTLRFAFVALFLAGLVLGVISMLVGIQKDAPPRTARSMFNLATIGAFVTATGAVGADYVLIQMCAAVATGASTPEAAAAEAEQRAKRYFRRQGR